MSGEIKGWLFEGEHLVRTVEIDGDPWWMAPDVCASLGLSNTTMALKKLDPDEKGLKSFETPGGFQEVNIVSEPGLYKLVGRSTKPVARRFDRWVRHDVLPAIRKTGRYEAAAAVEAEPIPSRPFDEWTPAELNSKISAVAEYRMSINPQAGQWALQRMGFPMPPGHIMGGRQYTLDLTPNP